MSEEVQEQPVPDVSPHVSAIYRWMAQDVWVALGRDVPSFRQAINGEGDWAASDDAVLRVWDRLIDEVKELREAERIHDLARHTTNSKTGLCNCGRSKCSLMAG